MENHIFSKSIIFSGIGSIFRALSFGMIKTRFKAFWDIFLKICMRTWIRRLRFSSNVAPGGRLSHEAYNGCCTKATLKIKRTSRHMRSISKYIIVNSFWPFSNALISIVWVNIQRIFPLANDFPFRCSTDLTFHQAVEEFLRAVAGSNDWD